MDIRDAIVFIYSEFISRVVEFYAKNCTVSTAGHTAGTGGRAGFTGKQVVFSAITCTDSIAVQHVKQSYETSFMTAMEGARDINLRFRVYPKPASDFLIIDAENSEMEKLYFLLYDFSSKLMVY